MPGVSGLHAAMQAFADYKELPVGSPSLRSFRRSLLHCHTECDDLTTSIQPLSIRLDYVVGREAAHRRRTRHVSLFESLSFFFFSTVDEMTNHERAVSSVHRDEFVKKLTRVNAIVIGIDECEFWWKNWHLDIRFFLNNILYDIILNTFFFSVTEKFTFRYNRLIYR